MKRLAFDNEVVARFWDGVDKSDPDGCWPWTRYVCRLTGYGHFRVGTSIFGTHRLALLLTIGRSPNPRKRLALHSVDCTSRACCRPDHLRWGSASENNIDRVLAGNYPSRTHCLLGHKFKPTDTTWRVTASGQRHRICGACERLRAKQAKQSKRSRRPAA